MYTVRHDGSIETDDIEQAVALSRRLRGNPPAVPRQVVGTDDGRALPPVPAAPAPPADPLEDLPARRRPRGNGSVFKVPGGWRWTVVQEGKKHGSGRFFTEEAAHDNLTHFLRTGQKVGRGRGTTSEAGADGLDGAAEPDGLNDDDDEEEEEEDRKVAPVPLPPAVPIPPPAPAPAPAPASAVGYIHPGAGWGVIAADGMVPHLNCDGTGMVTGRRCFGCQGQGRKRALSRPRR